MTWVQQYDPLGNVFLSALVAAVPVIVLLGLLGFFHARAHVAAFCGLVAALLIAVGVYRMPPLLAVAAAGYGVAFGLLPIGWIVLNAIFVFDITVHTAQFEIVKQQIAALSTDRRIQALLIAFCFGAFIEGAAGFGTPVAISAALLVALGFKPLHAAGLSLLGNTAPVAYGGLGAPLIALSRVTGLDLHTLSAMVRRQLRRRPILDEQLSRSVARRHRGRHRFDTRFSDAAAVLAATNLVAIPGRAAGRRFASLASRIARRLDAVGVVVRLRLSLGSAGREEGARPDRYAADSGPLS